MVAQIGELITSSESASRSSNAPQTHDGDDQSLIAAVAAGDSNALEQLYDRYATVVYRVALRMLKNRELAEDVVQEVFWRVWRRSASFANERGRVTQWLFGIAPANSSACLIETFVSSSPCQMWVSIAIFSG